MKLTKVLKMSVSSLISNKFRSFLSMLGMVIGIFSVILILCLGESIRNYAISKFVTIIGSKTLFVYSTGKYVWGVKSNQFKPIEFDDLEAILKEVDEIEMVSPRVNSGKKLKYKDRNIDASIKGVDTTFFAMGENRLSSGRVFNHQELVNLARVCVIGTEIKEELFLFEDAEGKYIKIDGQDFLVLGIIKPNIFMGNDLEGKTVLTPYTTMMSKITYSKKIYSAQLSGFEDADMTVARDKVIMLMRKRHKILADDPNDFGVKSISESIEQFNSFSRILTGGVFIIAAISLLVGGIGIMNIMLVTVMERTKEIGIRKALGARNRDILAQFLCESMVLAMFGSLLGTSMALGCLKIAGYFLDIPLSGVGIATIIAICFGSFIGIVFGFFPARRAASLDPIECLRHE